MLTFFAKLFDTGDFPPRWHCGLWTAGHGWLHIGSDLAVWLAYFTIPCLLVYFAAKKRDLPFRKVFWLFGAFILACGTTHLMEAVIFWWPAYRLAGVIKLVTALVSWGTVFALVPIIPQALAMRNPNSLEREVQQRTSELHQANEALRREVAERRHVELALLEQREWLRVTLSSIGDAVIAADSRGRITFLNPAAEQLTGWPADQAETCPLTSVFQIAHDGDDVLNEDPLERALGGQSGIGLSDHSTLIAKSGKRLEIEDNYAPIRDEQGIVRGVVLVFHDVTERRQAEQRVQLLARAYETLLTQVDVAEAIRAVAKLTVTAAADWCHIELLNAEGEVEQDVRVHYDPKREVALQQAPRRAVDAESVQTSASATLMTNDATRIAEALPFAVDSAAGILKMPHSLLRVPMSIRGHDVGCITLAITDDDRSFVADDRALAEELARRISASVENARLHRELQEADRRKNEFLSMLAHELRNPLAPVHNALLVLNESETSEATRHELQTVMMNQINHIIRLVDDLLDVSRIVSGKIELRMETIRLEDAVERALQTVRSIYNERGVKLDVELPQRQLRVKGDLVRLSQVVSNLLHNAAKYSPRGSTVHLTIDAEPHGVAVRFRDEGMGIEPEMITKVFDLFTQSTRTLERSDGGLGIGLTVVRNIVEMHGGSVSVQSAGRDRGSEFVVRLPMEDSPEVVKPSWQPTKIQPLRVLVVEDNVASARTLALMLKKFWNHDVNVAYNGLQALELAERCRPQLILMDIGLPNMNGYDVARSIRAKTGSGKPLIVALTGYGQAEDRRRSQAAGFDDHLVKPVAADVLEAIFAKVDSEALT